MKIVLLYGNMPHHDHGLSRVIQVIVKTLTELGMEVDEINLGFAQIPFYDGLRAQAVDDIANRIQSASGVIFACTAQLFAPSAKMQAFLEFLECDAYSGILREKHCMLVNVSASGGERSALEYLARVIQHFDAYECGRIGMQETHARGISANAKTEPGSPKDMVERMAEDFYRAIRQNRKQVIPRDSVAVSDFAINEVVQSIRVPDSAAPKQSISDVSRKLNLDSFTERQEQDIRELTNFFSQKLTKPDEAAVPPIHKAFFTAPAVPQPRVKSIKQITQSLPHYFQPQLSAGLNTVIQICVTGDDPFEGYLTIAGTECEYTDGMAVGPEITIITDASVWQDILKGKYTAQKAFMIGGLKVRGNLALMARFDTLFKI